MSEAVAIVTVEGVTKTYQQGRVEVPALRGLDLEVHPGELTALYGPSGSGKTTLLNLIGALDLPTSGRISIEGQDLGDLSRRELSHLRRDRIGFVFQAYNLIPVLTARENIEYVMKLQRRSQQECTTRSMEVAQKLGIETLLNKLPNQLSGGQQQRVAAARAVAATPKLILADEPTANLDSKTAASLMDMMERLNREEGVTIIFSSHDPLVISKARHSIVLKDGEVIADERIC